MPDYKGLGRDHRPLKETIPTFQNPTMQQLPPAGFSQTTDRGEALVSVMGWMADDGGQERESSRRLTENQEYLNQQSLDVSLPSTITLR